MEDTLTLDAIIPVLARPWRVKPLVASFTESVELERGLTARLVFVASSDDEPEIAQIRAAGYEPLLVGHRDDSHQYGVKTNYAAELSTADWLLTGADDLQFQAGWWREAMNVHIKTGALVIGTQDQGNQLVKRGLHSTHSLVHRSYVGQGTIDGSGALLCPLYHHNSVDVEFWETALHRGVAAFADRCVIRHDHPLWSREQGRGRVPRDATYNKGFANARADRALLNARRPLWRGRLDPGVRKNDPKPGRPRVVRARAPHARPR